MLRVLGVPSLDELIDDVVPAEIRLARALELPPAVTEAELLEELQALGAQNQVFRSFIGMGYSDSITPPVIQRNILENPGWYTQYTPYQAEIAQGRLEALLNFQTMVADLTGLPIANASLLDEATAAAEAMTMLHAVAPAASRRAADDVLRRPTTAIRRRSTSCSTRAKPLGIEVVVGDAETFDFARGGVLRRAGAVSGDRRRAPRLRALCRARARGRRAGRRGGRSARADAAHAAGRVRRRRRRRLRAALRRAAGLRRPARGVPRRRKDEFERQMPGRIVGVSQGRARQPGAAPGAADARAAHPPREGDEQHLHRAGAARRDGQRCTRVYHGPEGLRAHRRARRRPHRGAGARPQRAWASRSSTSAFFDTLARRGQRRRRRPRWMRAAEARRINLRRIDARAVGVSLDETDRASRTSQALLAGLRRGRRAAVRRGRAAREIADGDAVIAPAELRAHQRVPHPSGLQPHHTETEMLRYIRRLEARICRSTHSMIPLGSCTMKLNATTEMLPVTWPEFGTGCIRSRRSTQTARLPARSSSSSRRWLAEITGFAARLAAAQRRLAGRVRRPARHPRLPRARGEGAPQRLPHPRRRRTAPTPPAR